MDIIKSSAMQTGDVLGKRQQVSPPPTMLIKEHIASNKTAHIFTAKEVTSLQLHPDSLKQQSEATVTAVKQHKVLQQHKEQQQQRHHPAKYSGPGAFKQSPHAPRRSPPKPDTIDQLTERPDQVKISHEETTQRLRQFIRKRTINEAINSEKSGSSYQPWVPSVSNLRKATSEPNIKAKARPARPKLPSFTRAATLATVFSPRSAREIHFKERHTTMSEEQAPTDYSPPFKFPKLGTESAFFKSLPNMRNLDMADKSKIISPEEVRSHALFKEGALDNMSGSPFNTFYPSLAKLMNGDSVDRNKVHDVWRANDLWKGLRVNEPSLLTQLHQSTRPLFNGSLLNTAPERLDLSPKTILDYAQVQLLQMQKLSQEQEDLQEQQKMLLQQQEHLLKEQDALRQREVFLRKLFYDVSANMAVADHMVSSAVSQSHSMSPLSMSMPEFYNSSKHAEMLLKKAQEQQLAVSQAEQLLLLQRSAGNLKLGSAFGHYNPGSRNNINSLSAPNVNTLSADSPMEVPTSTRTGIIYDNIMLKHICTCSNPVVHQESPGRLSSIWARLTETGVASRCFRLKGRKASNEELGLVHSPEHVCRYGGARGQDLDISNNDDEELVKLKCGGIGRDDQTVWNDSFSAPAARLAAGSVVELATKVATGELRNAFALVRPPGHMAERSAAREGCYFNNLAIAAKYLTSRKLANRVLIVDWDLEHGNGLQQTFYNDDKVLVVNIHRYDNGLYPPRTGHVTCEGAGEGKGFNINIPFSGTGQTDYGDPEYLAAFRCVIKPVAEQFCPDVVLIAAGFNAMDGHNSYNVTAECFAFMTQELGRLAEGRIMLALEGGYNLVSLSHACELCIRSLLGEPITHLPARSLKCAPNSYAVKAIEDCINIHKKTWQFALYTNHISLSVYDAVKRDQEEVDTITALASLSMHHPNNFNQNVLNNGQLQSRPT